MIGPIWSVGPNPMHLREVQARLAISILARRLSRHLWFRRFLFLGLCWLNGSYRKKRRTISELTIQNGISDDEFHFDGIASLCPFWQIKREIRTAIRQVRA